ncbi:hypothetical protein CBR_g22908 [Chara braunii]|uniref:Fucosyltransferase n=1 Tax=Chara braunii TaxID=69332 RepID=A0A388L2Z8_CHABU|nr:hypothetical protein CBR_g22908 [Chara braunii]|eukprot:GBG76690.1 hypothetical protein CBR_g22908 [Chara braunii]
MALIGLWVFFISVVMLFFVKDRWVQTLGILEREELLLVHGPRENIIKLKESDDLHGSTPVNSTEIDQNKTVATDHNKQQQLATGHVRALEGGSDRASGTGDGEKKAYDVFDPFSCRSRKEIAQYLRHGTNLTLHFELEEFLKKYEDYHRSCSVGVDLMAHFNELIAGGNRSKSDNHGKLADCKYVVWICPWEGLGNRFASLASTFLYSILTWRVILVERRGNVGDLICEPFANHSWMAPEGLNGWSFNDAPDLPTVINASIPVFGLSEKPQEKENNSDASVGSQKSPESAAVSSEAPAESTGPPGRALIRWPPPTVSIRIFHVADTRADNMPFFCPQEQEILSEVKWVSIYSNQYFAPALFLLPQFKGRLNRWFPDGIVYTRLARHLFLPNNVVWERITRIHKIYLSTTDRLVGVQVRDMSDDPTNRLAGVLDCLINGGVLPQPGVSALVTTKGVVVQLPDSTQQASQAAVASTTNATVHSKRKKRDHKGQPGIVLFEAGERGEREPMSMNGSSSSNHSSTEQYEPRSKGDVTVFFASLRDMYYKTVKSIYGSRPTMTGERVIVHQEIMESEQKSFRREHEEGAFVDVWLLGFSDELITTPGSTFGYIAQAIAGLETPRRLNYYWEPKEIDAATKRERSCVTWQSREGCYHKPPWNNDKWKCRNGGHVYVKNQLYGKKNESRFATCEDFTVGIQLITK